MRRRFSFDKADINFVLLLLMLDTGCWLISCGHQLEMS